jgi:hypothetical protein
MQCSAIFVIGWMFDRPNEMTVRYVYVKNGLWEDGEKRWMNFSVGSSLWFLNLKLLPVNQQQVHVHWPRTNKGFLL